ncbi:MAG: DNA recombination protein RmuC [FCB group bacterium]|nr:DNA recombination protein RmuC [FCB group bacterium]
MLESILVIVAVIFGIITGWILRSRSIDDHSQELVELREKLTSAQMAEAAERARNEEIERKVIEEKARLKEVRAEMENAFKAFAGEALKDSSDQFLKMAAEKFKSLTEKADQHLTEKKKLIDQNLSEMDKKLKGIADQSIELKGSLQENRLETEKLRKTAASLHEVLSSSQKRGQWGERMVEDILQFIGLVENINYQKQSQVESGQRPDYTFKLPKEKVLNMDVKFPLAHYENYITAEDDFHRNEEKKTFLQDVKKHIKTVAGRAYINPAEGTLDYVMLFIPNESIYGFINKEDPELINFAMRNKVLLCSPLTLYAVLSLIHQATRNFAMEDRAAEVMNLVDAFRKQWEMYIAAMDKLGNSIESARRNYETLVTTRKRQLEKPLDKIQELSQGHQTEMLE